MTTGHRAGEGAADSTTTQAPWSDFVLLDTVPKPSDVDRPAGAVPRTCRHREDGCERSGSQSESRRCSLPNERPWADDQANCTGEAKDVSLAKLRDSSSIAASGAIPRVADAADTVLIDRRSDLVAGWIDNTFLPTASGDIPSLVDFELSPGEAAGAPKAAVALPKMALGVNGFNIPAPKPSLAGSDRAFKMPSQFSLKRPAVQNEAISARLWLARSLLALGIFGIAGVAALVLSPDARRQASEILENTQNYIGTLAPSARLVVQSQKGPQNEPLPSGLSLNGASGGETVTMFGLAPGTELSIGTLLSGSEWQLSASDLEKTFIASAKDFVGVMDATVILYSANGSKLDRQAIRFEWTNTTDDHLPSTPLAPERAIGRPVIEAPEQAAGPPALKATEQALSQQLVALPGRTVDQPQRVTPKGIVDQPVPAPPKSAAVVSLSPEVIAALVKRGDSLLHQRDPASARLFFQPAALAGNAPAALKLGMTYDRAFLTLWDFPGITPDEAQARAWYDRAIKLGSTEASLYLRRMAKMPK
jgi:hypothetical protein